MIHQIDIARRSSIAAAVVVVTFCLAAGEFSSGLRAQGRPERIILIPEVEKPTQICVKGGKAYIADARDIAVYSLDDGRLIRRIGGQGQGPGEFALGPGQLWLLADRLVVSDYRKLVFFSLAGDYLGQMNPPGGLAYLPYLPIGGHFVGFIAERGVDGSQGPPVGTIFDRDGKAVRKFGDPLAAPPAPPPPPGQAPPTNKTDRLMIDDYADCLVHDGKIYVADSRAGLRISVFDENGAPLYEIRHDIPKSKVGQDFKDGVIGELKASRFWDRMNATTNFVFPDYFPVFLGFKIADGRIYAVTSNRRDDLYEVIVMDLNGKILERAYRFPLRPAFSRLFFFRLAYDIENNRIHWFAYNDQKEQYELHIR